MPTSEPLARALPENVVVLRGELSSPPEVRLLESGARLASVQLRVRRADAPATSVPVTMWDPPTFVEGLSEGDGVCVLGRIERRFYRRGDGRTGSAVSVVASTVAPITDRRRLAALVRRVGAVVNGTG